ncbi:MAG: hypothetical protein H6557_18535 [Lewinellaceae bacterium]|nr:hypothetical protein [Lewinellaceae bacterium]
MYQRFKIISQGKHTTRNPISLLILDRKVPKISKKSAFGGKKKKEGSPCEIRQSRNACGIIS